MAKTKTITVADFTATTATMPDYPWAKSPALWLAARAVLDETDALAIELEDKWGVGRLRLIVDADMRERFDRQRYLLNQAIRHGQTVEDVRREGRRMQAAWRALDKAATAAGHEPRDLQTMEVALSDGTVAVICPVNALGRLRKADGRRAAVYTLEEVARLLEAHKAVVEAKLVWPGATITRIGPPEVRDPLDALDDTRAPLDDELPF